MLFGMYNLFFKMNVWSTRSNHHNITHQDGLLRRPLGHAGQSHWVRRLQMVHLCAYCPSHYFILI